LVACEGDQREKASPSNVSTRYPDADTGCACELSTMKNVSSESACTRLDSNARKREISTHSVLRMVDRLLLARFGRRRGRRVDGRVEDGLLVVCSRSEHGAQRDGCEGDAHGRRCGIGGRTLAKTRRRGSGNAAGWSRKGHRTKGYAITSTADARDGRFA